MELFLLYLFLKLDAIQYTAIFVFICFSVIAFCQAMNWYMDGVEWCRKWYPRWVVLTIIAGFIAISLPSTKQVGVLLAGWGVLEVVKSETAGRLASKSVQLIEQQLDVLLKKEKK